MGQFLSRATQSRTQAQIRYISPVHPNQARGLVAQVYAQVERDFGILAPPVSLHAPTPRVLAAVWLILRECLVATGQVSRAGKEAVAVAVSRANSCPYCVEVHGTALHGLLGAVPAAAIAEGRPGPGGEPARLARWAGRSGTGQAATQPFPASVGHAPELVGTAVTFHYLNRMVNIFLVESPIPPGVPAAARRVIRRAAGRILRPELTRRTEPGRSLSLLPAASLPADLAWAIGETTIAEAFARAAMSIEVGGVRSVPPEVRELVTAELAGWDGRPPGLSSDWLSAGLAGLPAEHHPVGRLALLTAMASYQVTPAVVTAVQRQSGGDQRLLEITSWASMAAARRMGAHLWPGPAVEAD